MLRHLFMDIAVEYFRLVGARILTEGMLSVKGECEVFQAVGDSEVPCSRLMSTMLTLHKVPSTIRVGCQRPLAEIGFYATPAVEGCIGMAIVVGKIEEAVDAAIEGRGEPVWHNLPAVITLEEEETALISVVILRLIELSVLSGILLHITVLVQTVIALQLAHHPRRGVCQTQVVTYDTIGSNLRIAY